MSRTTLVVATLDTKGYEAAFLCDRLRLRGAHPLLVDGGVLGEPIGTIPDITRAEVASAGGRTIDQIRAAGSRGAAIEQMMHGLTQLIPQLDQRLGIARAVGIGGAEGALLAGAALQALPFGIPKLIVSPVASGVRRVGPFVGSSDVALLHSVVDLQGLNRFSAQILDTAAGMIAGTFATLDWPEPQLGRVGMSLNGNSTALGTHVTNVLEQKGYEVVAFHSNGVGGVTMERLAAEGIFCALIDLTTNELVEEVVGGLFPVHDRLLISGRAGVPRVVAPGCLDFVCQGPMSEVAERFAGRLVDQHNPEVTLVQLDETEAKAVVEAFVERLLCSRGPVRVVVPTQGLSLAGSPGGVFSGRGGDGAIVRELRAAADQLPLTLVDAPLNDPAVAAATLDAFASLSATRRSPPLHAAGDPLQL